MQTAAPTKDQIESLVRTQVDATLTPEQFALVVEMAAAHVSKHGGSLPSLPGLARHAISLLPVATA
jgi:hypothetical protein